MDKQVKVLQIINGTSGTIGGIETFLTERYRRMDREKIRFDFAFTRKNTMELVMDDPVFKDTHFFATHAFEATTVAGRYCSFFRQIQALIKNNQYDVVHINSGSPVIETLSLMAASSCHVPLKIAHSHISAPVVDGEVQITTGIRAMLVALMKRYICKKADYLFACSRAAGETLFGKRAITEKKFYHVKNGVHLESLKYDIETRERCRAEEGVSDALVFGTVGRLSDQKNPTFIIKIFAEIRKKEKNAVLWLVGDGEKRDEVKSQIRELGLTDCVKMWGERKDVPRLMQAMDALLFPSLYEGLSIVAIEAQAAGLPVFASDTISEEHKISDSLYFLPLSAGPEHWVSRVLDEVEHLPVRKDMSEEIQTAGYDVRDSAAMLESIYLNHGKK